MLELAQLKLRENKLHIKLPQVWRRAMGFPVLIYVKIIYNLQFNM